MYYHYHNCRLTDLHPSEVLSTGNHAFTVSVIYGETLHGTNIYAAPKGFRPDKKNSLYGDTFNKIWSRKLFVCPTNVVKAMKLALCSSRDGVSLK